MRITAENTIALVIDIQEKLVPSIYAHKYLVKTTQNLLEALNILNIPKIIALNIQAKNPHQLFGRLATAKT